MFPAIRRSVALVASLASLCALSDEPVRIGVSGPFTGGAAFMGISMRDGARLAAAEINARGGVLGRPLLLVERDDENKRERYLEVARELVEREKVAATVGFINSVYAQAAHALYQKAQVPAITNVATGTVLAMQFSPPAHEANYIFKVTPNDDVQGERMVEEALENRKARRIAIVVDASDYGGTGRDILARELDRRGVKPVAVERLDAKGDLAPAMVRLRDVAPEAVLVYGYASGLGRIVREMERSGLRLRLIGPWTLSMPDFATTAGGNAEGAIVAQTFLQEGEGARQKAFVEAYQRNFNPPGGRIPSPMSAAQGYDSVHLLAAAIRQAGSTDGRRIREALEDLREKVDGVVAGYQRPFSRQDHEAIKKSMVVMGALRQGSVMPAR